MSTPPTPIVVAVLQVRPTIINALCSIVVFTYTPYLALIPAFLSDSYRPLNVPWISSQANWILLGNNANVILNSHFLEGDKTGEGDIQTFACPEEECDATFANLKALSSHRRWKHSLMKRASTICPVEECMHIFNSRK